MLKEVIHYYSDTEPTREEIETLKNSSLFEKKVIFVEYYCEYKDAIITLEFNNGQMNIRQTWTNNNYHQEEVEASKETLGALMKKLRDETGMGLIDCKAALLLNKCDLEAAKNWLREKGLA